MTTTASSSPASDVFFSGPAPDNIPINGVTYYPNPGKGCFTCDPPYAHARDWKPDPKREGRTLVLCFDGTGDSFDDDNSNVVQFLTMLMKDDPTKQLVYYQAGIGTYTSNSLKTPIIEAVTKIRDKMFARSVGAHIKDGYRFLMQNYRFGDKICIFGFSRGAFTARALAGMVQKVGLLPAHNFEQLPFAYAMYQRQDKKGVEEALMFKRAFSIDVRITFVGVWDTVESVGWANSKLPFCGSNNGIQYFRHALALDERRVKFIPTFWGAGSEPKQQKECPTHRTKHEITERIENLHVEATDVEEVFFAGAHCDVGGGSVKNGTRHSLARIPLRWMIRECFKVKTGIIFDAHMVKNEVGLVIEPNLTVPILESLSSIGKHIDEHKSLGRRLKETFDWIMGRAKEPESTKFISDVEPEEELGDALSPIYDQFDKRLHWKFMDYCIPWIIRRSCTDPACFDPSWIPSWNFGQGRIIHRHKKATTTKVKVHRSVKARIQAIGPKGKSYLPKARFWVGNEARPLKREEWLAGKPGLIEWVGDPPKDESAIIPPKNGSADTGKKGL